MTNAAPIALAQALWKAEREQPGAVREIAATSGLGLRKAYYLLKIWDRLAPLRLSRTVMAEVGWTKLAVIANHAQPGSEAEALNLARQHTAKDLESVLRSGSAARRKTHSVLLRLSPSEHRAFEAALRAFDAQPARNGKGLSGKEQALSRMLKALGFVSTRGQSGTQSAKSRKRTRAV